MPCVLIPHGRYDSVLITGQLRWQDRLNNYNLPFFIPSTGFFTNYTVSLPHDIFEYCIDFKQHSGPLEIRLSLPNIS